MPAAYLSSLQAIVLTDAASVGAGRTKRVKGRKFDRRACRGFYRRKHTGSAASIDIVVDNVVAGYHPLFLAFRIVRERLVADVLFHELGHHLDATIGAAAPSGEAAAEDWNRRLARSYFQRRYWWLRPIAKVLLPLVRWMRRRRGAEGP